KECREVAVAVFDALAIVVFVVAIDDAAAVGINRRGEVAGVVVKVGRLVRVRVGLAFEQIVVRISIRPGAGGGLHRSAAIGVVVDVGRVLAVAVGRAGRVAIGVVGHGRRMARRVRRFDQTVEPVVLVAGRVA